MRPGIGSVLIGTPSLFSTQTQATLWLKRRLMREDVRAQSAPLSLHLYQASLHSEQAFLHALRKLCKQPHSVRDRRYELVE